MQFPISVGSQTIFVEDLPELLERYQLMPQLLKELVIEDSIALIPCSPEEVEVAYQEFCKNNKLDTPEAEHAWFGQRNVSRDELNQKLSRKIRLDKFQLDMWGRQLESVFLQHKDRLDKATYSLLRTQDPYVAQELYCRVQEGEQSFAELAKEHSQGPEMQTGGMVGPVQLGKLHPTLAHILSTSQPGEIHPPTQLNEWYFVVRLEQLIPAQLDEAMRRNLLRDLYNGWLEQQVTRLRGSGDGVAPAAPVGA